MADSPITDAMVEKDSASRALCSWFGYDFDFLHEGRLREPHEPWVVCSGGRAFQGRKDDVRDFVAELVRIVAPEIRRAAMAKAAGACEAYGNDRNVEQNDNIERVYNSCRRDAAFELAAAIRALAEKDAAI